MTTETNIANESTVARIDVTREFAHTKSGTEFDNITLSIPDGDWTLTRDGTTTTLGTNAKHYLTYYALRCYADSFAGIGESKTVDDGIAAFNKRHDSLINDTAGVRKGGGTVSIEVAARRNVCRGIVRENKTKEAYNEWKDGDSVAADLDGLHDQMSTQSDTVERDKYLALVAAEVAAETIRRAAAKEKKSGVAAIAKKVELTF